MATINAADAGLATVTQAVTDAGPGGTVILPADDVTWTGTLRITYALTIQGAGTGQTIVRDGLTNSSGAYGARSLIYWSTVASGAHSLSGVSFIGATGTGNNWGKILLDGLTTSMQIFQCVFDQLPDTNISVYGGVYGCIYSNTFTLPVSNIRAVNFFNGNRDGGGSGDAAWTSPTDWGTANFMYFESNTVTKLGSTVYSAHDGWQGCRAVCRYNTYTNVRVTNHGTESSQRQRGARAYEVYENTFISPNNPQSAYIDIRSGSLIAFNNTVTGFVGTMVKLNDYRTTTGFQPWGIADGTKLWDAATGGVHDSGTTTAGGTGSVADTAKAWTTNQWSGYTLRLTRGATSTGGGLRSFSVLGAGWTTNQWSGWEFTRTSDNTKSRVSSNTADTLTLASDFFSITGAAGQDFVLSSAAYISSNTGTTLSLSNNFQGTPFTGLSGFTYEIRKVDWILDGAGRGQCDPFTGSGTVGHQNVNQTQEPVYAWDNTINGSTASISNGGYSTIVLGRDYFNSAKSGYTPYTYPHPLRGALAAPTVLTNPSNQTVTAGDDATFTCAASGNPAPTYQWRKNGSNISGATSASLVIVNAQDANEGTYDCVCTNSEGSATTTGATLTVNAAADTTPPTPNPSTIASVTVNSSTQITVQADIAVDALSSPVQYDHSIGGVYQGYQSSPIRVFTGLTAGTLYSFRVRARDASGNETTESSASTATTTVPTDPPGNPFSFRSNAMLEMGAF